MKYLPLSLITPLEKEMKERGVSEVARSSRGFLTAYRDAGGRENRLSDWWQNRRDNFVKRHMAQVKKRDESLWDDDGRPSRRHLALIAWAYSPDRTRVERYIKRMRKNPKPGSKADDRDQGQPALPRERIKGSSVNKPGSATAKGSASITLSEKTEKALRKKVEDHNAKYGDTPSKRVTYRMLAAVYRRGAGAFSKSHRPGMQRAQWAFARVNHFLKIVRRGYPDDSKYIQDNDLLPKGHKRSTRENPMKDEKIKIDCAKCDGTGTISAFRHIKGGQCFACKGRGYFLTTRRREEAKRKKREQERAETKMRVEDANKRFEQQRKKYMNDPRLGQKAQQAMTLDYIEDFNAQAAAEYIRILSEWDADPSWPDKYPWLPQRLKPEAYRWDNNLRQYVKKTRSNPFKSQAQRRLFYAKMRDGEISPKVVREWERETGSRRLPERVNPSHKALKKYKDTHWGIEANGVMRKDDPDLPRELVEMGKLLEIGVIPETQEKPYAIAFPDYEKTSLAFSQGKDERLYPILPKRAEQAVKREHWKPNEPTVRLGEVNKLTGGRLDKFRCPAIQVQVLGRANYVIYQTQKLDDMKEDGQASHYIHELGEESGILPYLCVAQDGTLWFAGGNYRVLNAGIAD